MAPHHGTTPWHHTMAPHHGTTPWHHQEHAEMHKKLEEERQRSAALEQVQAEKVWMEAALVQLLESRKRYEGEIAHLITKVRWISG
ncbi:unnamed protein product [Closterium sp. NIES-54]